MTVNGRTKGLTAERAVANYLKAQGWPDAKRSVATGWSNGSTESGDIGDILGVPGFAVQVKNLKGGLTGKALDDVYQEALAQAVSLARITGRDSAAIIIEKRAGTADVGRWWAHLSNRVYLRALTGRWQFTTRHHLVRVQLGDVIGDLRLWSAEVERGQG